MRAHVFAFTLSCLAASVVACAEPSSTSASSAHVPAGLTRVAFELDKVP